jgi:hypothetical protein
VLVVVQRGRKVLYDALSKHWAYDRRVRVVWDRRVRERRARGGSVAVEQRRGDRRRPPPSDWGPQGFLVVTEVETAVET